MPSSFVKTQKQLFDYFRTGGLSWYAGLPAGATLSTITPAINTLIATPFLVRSQLRFDTIQFEVTVLAVAGVAVVGIYNSLRDGTQYPANLILQGTQQDTSTVGLKPTTISGILSPDTLYWFVYSAGVLACQVRGLPVSVIPNVLGNPGTGGPTANITGWSLANAYSATLPATFPGGGVVVSGVVAPAIFVRAT